MKTEQTEQLILLQQSGEINDSQTKALNNALQNPEKQKTKDAYQWLIKTARDSTEPHPQNSLVTERILQEAKAQTNKTQSFWHTLSIAAALIIILVGSVIALNYKPTPAQVTSTNIDTAIKEFAELFTSANENLTTFDAQEDLLDQFSESLLAYNE